MEKKQTFIGSNKAILVQTIMLIIALVGIALAAERRITIVETTTKNEREMRMTIDKQLADSVKEIQTNQIKIIEVQARTTVLLGEIEKRHQLEDTKRIRN